MIRFKKSLMIIFAGIALAWATSNSFAAPATFTANFNPTAGTPDFQTFQLYLIVSNDFTYTPDSGRLGMGTAIPAGWAPSPNFAFDTTETDPNTNLFTFGAVNTQFASNPLKAGTLGSFEFDGTVLGIDYALSILQTFDYTTFTGENRFQDLGAEVIETIVTPIPAPGSIFLLTGGLIGLVALRRKKA